MLKVSCTNCDNLELFTVCSPAILASLVSSRAYVRQVLFKLDLVLFILIEQTVRLDAELALRTYCAHIEAFPVFLQNAHLCKGEKNPEFAMCR